METTKTTTMETSTSNDYLSWLAANQIAELRRDVAKSEADLKHFNGNHFCEIEKSIGDAECNVSRKIGDAECSINKNVDDVENHLIDRMGTYAADNFKNQSDIAQRYTGQLNAAERDLQNRIHENRFVLTKEIGDKNDRTIDTLGRDFTDVKNQLRYFEASNAEKFCDLKTQGLLNTQKVLDELAKNKYDALKDELDEERSKRHFDKYASDFALQSQDINYLKQMISSVEQTQKFSSKTTQFGTGNLAGTAQTANQG